MHYDQSTFNQHALSNLPPNATLSSWVET
jgi:hypothetical protein